MNGYQLTRCWYDFKFSNPSKVKAKHSDMYFYLVDRWNRLGQKKEFGLPTSVTMEALQIGSYNTYKDTLKDLVSFGFVKIVKESVNQYQSKIIALSKIDKATDKALDKATDESPDTIYELKEQKKDIIDWSGLLAYFNKVTGKNSRKVNDKAKKQFRTRLKEGYTKEDIMRAIQNAYNDEFHISNNHKHITLEFISRPDKLDKFSSIEVKKKKQVEIVPHDWYTEEDF